MLHRPSVVRLDAVWREPVAPLDFDHETVGLRKEFDDFVENRHRPLGDLGHVQIVDGCAPRLSVNEDLVLAVYRGAVFLNYMLRDHGAQPDLDAPLLRLADGEVD